MRSWRVRLLLAFILLSLAACDQNEQASQKNPQLDSQADELHKTNPNTSLAIKPKKEKPNKLPPITFDLEKDAAPFLIAVVDHLVKPFEGTDEYYELVIDAEKIDTLATLKAVKNRPEIPFCAEPFPKIQTFITRLEEDEELQLLSASIIDPSKDQQMRSRPVLQKARESLLKSRLEEFIKGLGPVESPYLEINKKLKAIIKGK